MRSPFKANEIKEQEIDAHVVGHLPIVKAYAEKIGLVDILNELIPSEMDVDPGTVFLGMILDTLSGRTPLYRLNDFFKEQDAELLLGKKVEPEKFSDYNVTRVLGKAYAVGTMKIFTNISRRAADIFNIDKSHVHFDTTSVSVYGAYDQCNDEGPDLNITYGHSKDHRPDLKQFLVSMLCVDRNVPIFGKLEDGNESDKNINNKLLTTISKRMAEHGMDPKAFIYIADAAMITGKNLAVMGDDVLFISRFPANYTEHRRVIKDAILKNEWEDLGVLAHSKPTKKRPAAHYKAYESEIEIDDKKYRAIVIHSSSNDKRRRKRIERELNKELKSLNKLRKKICKKNFFCEKDAIAAGEELKKEKSKYHMVNTEIEQRAKHKIGRPKKGEQKQIKEMRYGLDVTIEQDTEAVAMLRQEAGCFVMITNVSKQGEDGYDAKEVLGAYKEQHGIEQNFAFLKDPLIVNSIFLKKPERIEVLGLVLLLSLLVWRLIERDMRNYVETKKKDLPGWLNRRTTRPTTFMFMTKFQFVMIIKIGSKRRLKKPFTSEQKEYLSALNVSQDIFIEPRAG